MNNLSDSYFNIQFPFIKSIMESGGECHIYGGVVRDRILGIAPKDYDFVVRKLNYSNVLKICNEFGIARPHFYMPGSIRLLTKDFGIIDICLPKKLKSNKLTYSKNNSVGDHIKTLDFTINSLTYNLQTCEIFDLFNSVSDLKNKIISLIPTQNDIIYNPILPIRAARFLAGLNFTIDDRTMFILDRDKNIMFDVIPTIILKNEMLKLLRINNESGINFLKKLGIFKKLNLL